MNNEVMDSNITDAPEYLDQLIVYEIATKNFTSPTGPESGTFASLEEKLPYLEELGLTVSAQRASTLQGRTFL